MSVVGFDVGTYSSYIGVARAGGIETIANEYSDRCTHSCVSLSDRSRFIGMAARQQMVTNYKNTLVGFKRALGRIFKDPFIQRERERFFRSNVIQEAPDGMVHFKIMYMGEEHLFTATELMGMLLTKLKQTAEAGLKTKVVDVVISVPAYFTEHERRALLDSSAVAGLNCLRLVNDTTAAALGYGITKQELPAATEKPMVVVFVDFGYSALQVCACAFNKGKLKMLAALCDCEVGGRNFDDALAKHFSELFRQRFDVDAESRAQPKAYIRLLQECERLKKLISANTQQIPLNIECFMDDKDVSGKMNRDEFEKLTSHLLQRIERSLLNIMTVAKVKTGDIHSVEILGGSSRIPAFKRLVAQVFQQEPVTTLNADEAVARGCALQCAILSPTFRVREFSINDCQMYPITLAWQPQNKLNEDSCVEVFPQFHQIPMSKMLTFYRSEPFVLSAGYSAAVPYPSREIGAFKVNNVSPQADGESANVKVKVRVNGSGLFSVASATTFEKLDDGEPECGVVVDGKPADPAAAAPAVCDGLPDDSGMQADQDHAEQKTGVGAEEMTVDTAGAEQKTDGVDKGTEKEEEVKPKKKSKTKKVDLPVESYLPRLSPEVLNRMMEREANMILQDWQEKERADAKNYVEEYVYYMRDRLSAAYAAYMEEQACRAFVAALDDTENWLYGDGENQKRQVYVDRLSELKKTGQAVHDRFTEAQQWPTARDQFGSAVMQAHKFLEMFHGGDELFAHIDTSDVEKVSKCLEEKLAWWGPKMEMQSRIKPHEDPVLLVQQVYNEKRSLESICFPIMNKPKPKVEPPSEASADNSGASVGHTNNVEAPAVGTADAGQAATVGAKLNDMDVD